MARALNRLSARGVATASTPGYYADGGGLYLQVVASGAKTWIFRYRYRGRRPEMGLGPVHTVGLAAAREAAAGARRQLLEGLDPMETRRAAQAARAAIPTFGQAATSYIDTHRHTWRNPKHIAQWENTLATHAKLLTPLPIDRIDTPDVIAVLKPLWTKIEHCPAKGFLFPLPYGEGGALSENAMTALLERMGYKHLTTAHGFRSSFKDWASEETEFSNEVSEMALAHKIKDKTEAAYRRGKLLTKRRELMVAWARYCGY